MTEIDTDKLRTLDEAARRPGISMPGEPAWLIERDKRENARKQLAAALRESLPAILAITEENKRLREALEKIGDSAPNHCVCCTMMGKTARAALRSGEREGA